MLCRTVLEQARAAAEIRRQKDLLAVTLASIGDGVIATDPQGHVTFLNGEAERLTGWTTAEACGQPLSAVFRIINEHTRQPVENPVEKVLRLGAIIGLANHTLLVAKDGREIPIDDSGAPIRRPDGTIEGVILVFRDITGRKQAEEELRRAKAAAEAANRAKSEFLANMSHEIRTPMTAVLGFADLLLMSPDLPQDERRMFLEGIQNNGKALLGLIDDILDLSRIEADRLPFESVMCPLRPIVDDVLAVVQIEAKRKGLNLDVDCRYPLPETICTDPARLRQVLVNLVGNAVKFTARGGVRITLRHAAGADGGGQVQFAISDTGIGIPADKIAELFQSFTQVDASSSRRHGGTGLGLAISRRLAKSLGGDIAVSSELGQGSTFTLTIAAGPLLGVPMLHSAPVAPRRDEPLPAQRNPPAACAGRLLLAEDVPDVRLLVQAFLEKMAVRVDVAADGLAACEMAEKSRADGQPYDLILMDIQMPALNGYEATRRLRDKGWQGPIVALTAYAMVGDREKCLAAGCDDYLTKPIKAERLRELLARFMPGPAAAAPAASPAAQETAPASLDRLRQHFLSGLPERARLVEDAWRAGDRAALSRVAHQLKGTAGAYGQSGLAQAAADLETQASGGSDPAQLQGAVTRLLDLCRSAGPSGCGE